MPNKRMPFHLSAFLVFLTLVTLVATPARADRFRPEVALRSSLLFGSETNLGGFAPGGQIEGYARIARWIGAGLAFSYNRVTDMDFNLYRFGVVGDVHPCDDESRIDPFIGATLMESVYNAEQGLAVSGRVGVKYEVIEHLLAQVLAEYTYSLGLATQNHPDYSSGTVYIGVGYAF